MSDKQAQAAMMRRQKVKAHILAHNGLSNAQIGQALNLSETAIRNHTHPLVAEGEIDYLKNPNASYVSGSLPGLFGPPGFKPVFPVGARVDSSSRVYVKKRFRPHDDFLGRKIAPAVQIGIARDPLIAALFGAGGAA